MLKQTYRLFFLSVILTALFLLGCKNPVELNSGDNSDPSSISGFVWYAGTEVPVVGAVVTINSRNFTTDINGYYELLSVTPGDHDLSVTKTGFNDYLSTIAISSSQATKKNIPLSAVTSYSISGTIRNNLSQNIVSARIIILNPDGSESSIMDYTDTNGHYQLPTVPQGSREIKVEATDYQAKTITTFMNTSDKIFDINLSAAVYDGPGGLLWTPDYSTPRAGTASWNPVAGSTIQGYRVYRRLWVSPYDGYVEEYVELSGSIINAISFYTQLPDFLPYDISVSTVNIDGIEGTATILGERYPQPSVEHFGSSIAYIDYLTTDGSNLWGLNNNTMYKISMDSWAVESTFTLPAEGGGITFDGTSVIVFRNGSNQIYFIDPGNGSITETQIHDWTESLMGAAYKSGYLYVFSTSSYLMEFDEVTLERSIHFVELAASQVRDIESWESDHILMLDINYDGNPNPISTNTWLKFHTRSNTEPRQEILVDNHLGKSSINFCDGVAYDGSYIYTYNTTLQQIVRLGL